MKVPKFIYLAHDFSLLYVSIIQFRLGSIFSLIPKISNLVAEYYMSRDKCTKGKDVLCGESLHWTLFVNVYAQINKLSLSTFCGGKSSLVYSLCYILTEGTEARQIVHLSIDRVLIAMRALQGANTFYFPWCLKRMKKEKSVKWKTKNNGWKECVW